MKSLVMAALALALSSRPSMAADPPGWSVTSPDGKVALTVGRSGEGDAARLVLSASVAGAPILGESPLGIVRDDARFAEGLTLASEGAVVAHESKYTVPHGKRREVADRYNERVLGFKDAQGHTVELHLRAYDDGVAYRYRFPEDGSKATRTVREELSGFRLPEGSTVWANPHDDPGEYTPGYETFWKYEVPAGTPAPKAAGWSFPLLYKTPAGRWGLITEAALDRSYCGGRLAGEAPGGLYKLRFPDAGEGNNTGSVEPSWTLPWATPWRVVIAGESPATIVESTLVENLNPPSRVADTSWIKPGRSSWSWLSDPPSPQDASKLKPFADLAAEMGWEYTLIDANWDIMRNGTVHDVIAYAKSKGVGVLMWYNSGGPHNYVTERPRGLMDLRKVRRAEFQRLAEWGVKGVKVDFFQSDKQNVIALYQDILEDAADFKIMVNFHGCTLPRGWSRTYPHLMSMEAVRGEESYLFDEKYPAEAPRHNAIQPFTRNAVGPMDITPVMLRDNRYKRLTTAAHEMALPIVFETGILHFAGTVGEYLELPPVPKEYLKSIPVTWDETKLLAGEPGRFAAIARRKGSTWYLGVINGEGQPRELSLDLKPLGDGTWKATILEDGESHSVPLDRKADVASSEPFRISLKPNGGLAAVLVPGPGR
ncbi:Retaining alpha-galactosidase precursor [Aquisphaera giovannonii]|uniref:Retaining alpha-galactosidase n=1 Tax=Aquisphaera giovannonii TaxID=406548 RepID=A0A5B9VW41_9BACT|nr:glycoside hydrolase family 97 protein [Aquisphaera giovannonii]QEH32284.1 Retaining alpha-galactosidase precursor [Aquisphaera giovannonii]